MRTKLTAFLLLALVASAACANTERGPKRDPAAQSAAPSTPTKGLGVARQIAIAQFTGIGFKFEVRDSNNTATGTHDDTRTTITLDGPADNLREIMLNYSTAKSRNSHVSFINLVPRLLVLAGVAPADNISASVDAYIKLEDCLKEGMRRDIVGNNVIVYRSQDKATRIEVTVKPLGID